MLDDTAETLQEGSGRQRRRLDLPAMLRSLVLPLAVLAVILGGLWYWQSRGGGSIADDPRYGIVELPAAKNPTGRAPASEIGRAGPDFLLEQPRGGELRLSDLQGHPVVINFWATWCPPCRQEIPELVAAYAQYGDDGLVIVGINLQEADAKVLAFASDFGMTFPIVIDRDGELGDVWRLGGPIKGLPTSYFVDETGVIRNRYYGPLTDDALEKRLAEILPGGTD